MRFSFCVFMKFKSHSLFQCHCLICTEFETGTLVIWGIAFFYKPENWYECVHNEGKLNETSGTSDCTGRHRYIYYIKCSFLHIITCCMPARKFVYNKPFSRRNWFLTTVADDTENKWDTNVTWIILGQFYNLDVSLSCWIRFPCIQGVFEWDLRLGKIK